MSDSDNPFDQKRGERTIIRINRSGSQQAPVPDAPPAGPGPAAGRLPEAGPPRAPDTAADVWRPPHNAAGGSAAAYGAAGSNAGGAEDWIRAQARTPAPAASLGTLPEIDLNDLVSPHENPIIRAAGPLLMLLGRLHAAVMRAPFASLMEQVAEAMRFFEKDIRSAGIPEEQARVAKYVLCATADDIVQNIPTDDRHVWTRYSMLARFFNERTGGVRFFEEVDRAKLDPLRNFPLLELQYTCLALGFQGMHRSSPNGQSAQQQ